MAPLESVFVWVAIALYALASGAAILSLVFRKGRIMNNLYRFAAVLFVLHTAAIAARYYAQGYLPWAGEYESALMGGWFVILFTAYVTWTQRGLQALAVGTFPFTLVLLGYGVMTKPVLGPMEASLKTFWLYVHVFFAWLAFGAFVLAMAAGIIYLLKKRDTTRAQRNPIYEKMPSLERLDDLIFRYILFGFMTDAVMIASGAIWAKELWGNYWSWDPVEVWNLFAWLMYGIIIHLRVTFGWRGNRLAWLSVLAIVFMVMSFFGVNFAVESSYHIFNVR